MYISEYTINNHTHLAQIVRENRIKAYRYLRTLGQADIRPDVRQLDDVKPIKSNGLGVGYGIGDRFFMSHAPIYYNEYEPFDTLDIKKMNCLSSDLVFSKEDAGTFRLTLVDIENRTQYNPVVTPYSWRLKSEVGYQHRVLTEQSFEWGQSYRIARHAVVFGFLGLNYANYDTVIAQPLEADVLRPSAQFGVMQAWDQLRAQVGYIYRYDRHYMTADLSLSLWSWIPQVSYNRYDNQDYIRLSAMVLF